MKWGHCAVLAALLAAPLGAQVQSGADFLRQSQGANAASEEIDCDARPTRPAQPPAPAANPVYGPGAPVIVTSSPVDDFCAEQSARRNAESRARLGLGPKPLGTSGMPDGTPANGRTQTCRTEPDGNKRCVWSSSSDPNQKEADNPARQTVERLLDKM